MDGLTFLGLITSFLAILCGQMCEGGSIASLLNFPAFMIVMGGTLGAVMVQTPFRTFRRAFRILPRIFKPPAHNFTQTRDRLIDLAKITRQYGILTLEQHLERELHPLVRQGLELLVVGIDKATVRQVLEAEIDHHEDNDERAALVFESMGGYSPTIGILGAVLGLIQVLQNLADPAHLGAGIAVAFVATIYGVGLANLVFLPVANKLKSCIANQVHHDEMIVEGMVSMATGESPNTLSLKLNNYGLNQHHAPKKNRIVPREDTNRWIVSYADFITLLFAFFVVMYSISSVNSIKYQSLTEGMHSAFSKNDKKKNLNGAPVSAETVHPTYSNPGRGSNENFDALNRSLLQIQDEDYQIDRHDGWIELDIKAGALFDSGSADLKAVAFLKLIKVAQIIKATTYPIALEGYTDDVPIQTSQYPSNWELSSARAAALARSLTAYGVQPERISVTGYGEQFPVATNDTEEGRARNRRVNLIIAKDKSVPRLLNPEVKDIQVTNSLPPINSNRPESKVLDQELK